MLPALLFFRLAMAFKVTNNALEEDVHPMRAMGMLAVRQNQSDFKEQMSPHPGLDNIRVLLYITTHLPDLHVQFLRKCWPGLISNSALLQHADVLLFAGGSLPTDILEDVFRGKNVRVQQYKNPGYQEGAMLAMEAATSGHWFDGYDWVIRLNPDVLILEDEWLIKTLADDGVDGIFANCFDSPCTSHCTEHLVNSDFYAVRPSQLGPASFIETAGLETAELQVSAAFGNIMEAGRDRWVPGTEMAGSCRIHGPGVPVLHAHSVLNQCPLAKGEPKDRDLM